MALMANRDEFKKLADDMEANPDEYNPNDLAYAPALIQEIIVDLRKGEFDDFDNNKYPAPKIAMAEAFGSLGRQDIVDRVKNGDFDQ